MQSANSSTFGSQIGVPNPFSASPNNINQLEKRKIVLNLMIKSCELLEYLTRSHKSPYSVLDVDPLSLKKMVNREYSNIHVE